MIGIKLGLWPSRRARLAAAVLALFANGEAGAWYDPTNFASMYQDVFGTIPVTSVEQPVGLWLDSRYGLARGVESAPNPGGPFTSAASFVSDGAAVISVVSGAVRVQNNPAGGAFSKGIFPVATVPGRGYEVKTARKGGWTGGGYVSVGTAASGGAATNITANRIESSFVFFATSAISYVGFQPGGTQDPSAYYDWDAVSVKEIPGIHAIQPVTTSRGILSARVNLLVNSNAGVFGSQLQNVGSAPPSRANVPGTYPDGTIGNVVEITWPASGDSRLRVEQIGSSISAATPYGFSVYSAPTPNGPWTRQTATGTLSSGTAFKDWNPATSGMAPGQTGYLCCFQTEANTAVSRYQRVNASTDYDTAGFPMGIRCDGADDGYFTASNVDFTGTNKMTVCAGVRNLAADTARVILELGPNSGTLAGSIGMFAPLSAASNASFRSGGSVMGIGNTFNVAAVPLSLVLTGAADIAAPSVALFINGVSPGGANTASQGTGNYRSDKAYIGRRFDSQLPFNGLIFGIIVRGAASSAFQVAVMEQYINQNARVY